MSKSELARQGETADDPGKKLSIEDGLKALNTKIQQAAYEAGFPVGSISTEGAGDNADSKLKTIKDQYDGIIERAAIPPKELLE